jgi:REP element-mobilizing transposase RayT
MRGPAQIPLPLPQRGGKRTGAGRKPAGRKARVSHKARPRFDRAAAVHVTLRVADHVWNLRSRRAFRLVEQCLADALGRFGLRVVQFTVMGNHVHLIVEADSSQALSRGMQGLSIRIAKALNRLMNSRGSVFADHFHSRILKTPTELTNAIGYVLGNLSHHFGGRAEIDRFSSAALDAETRERVLSPPRTWLLRAGWMRARRVPHGLGDQAY